MSIAPGYESPQELRDQLEIAQQENRKAQATAREALERLHALTDAVRGHLLSPSEETESELSRQGYLAEELLKRREER